MTDYPPEDNLRPEVTIRMVGDVLLHTPVENSVKQEDGSYDFVRELDGDSVSDILAYVEYDPHRVLVGIRKSAERAVRENRITPAQRYQLMQAFEDGLRGYTYFER